MDSLGNSTLVAGYRVDGVLGEGGMGTVYRATQLSLERVVALKVLTAELSSDPAFRERFRREGLLQAALDHPHIVTVYEAGETDQRLFLAMQLVEGPTMKALIDERRLGDRRILRLLTQVAEALDAAHAKGLIHRDVKPQNVLVGVGDHAYLADFGLTRASDDLRMTATGLFVGTIDYISPEQARGERATARTDVYALSAVLYECLTGQVPFVRTNDERVLLAHLSEDPPRVTDVRDDLPPGLDDVIARGMAKDPADRPASAHDLMLSARRVIGVLPTGSAAAATTRIASVPTPVTSERKDAATERPAATLRAQSTVAGGERHGTVEADAPLPPRRDPLQATRAAPAGHIGRFILVLGVAALLAAGIGVFAGDSGSGSRTVFADSVSAGNIELAFPSSWRRVAPTEIAGLALSDTIALAPGAARAGARVLAGVTHASGPALLPGALLGGRPASPSAVLLGTTAAYRYSDLSLPGVAAPATIYVVPTTVGVATVLCLAGPSGASRECAQIAATLKLNSASAFPLAPSQAYASALGRTFAALQRSSTRANARLDGAHSAGAQSAAAEALAAAFHRADASVASLAVSPATQPTNASVAAALERIGRGYSALAAAASAEDSGAYTRATLAVSSAGAALRGALAELGSAGYSVGA